ncbi:MAG TPA: amidohydrolase/deacetylase family metallohydrolase [Candidatus Methylomirabilis sp.]|nr:amidohydrolase/deacetylase family metallohydrolase [Candidatus Methylomirabilis sp.]
MYDLLIKGGSVIDPAKGLQEIKDLAIERGRIVSVARDIPRDLAWEVLDASGHLVTPGLIDIHVHVYPGVSHYGVDPDPTCLARGVTTVCDAGSSGADTFDGLRRYVIEISETRILAFLNISAIGMISPLDNELADLKQANPERAIGVCERHRDVIQGVKVRLSRSMVGDNGLQPLLLARRAAEAVGMPLMVHVGDTPSPLGEILSELRPRDILTHCFHGRKHGILDEKGEVLPEVREAVKRGVVLDVGHGVGSFSFEVARRALRAGLTPGTISSDLHFYNVNGPVFDLATTMSKFLLLGLPLSEVLAKTTTTPAALLGLSDRVGSLQEGFLADVAIFKVCAGDFEFEDSLKEKVHGAERLEPVAVIRGGRVYRSQLRLERKYGHRF